MRRAVLVLLACLEARTAGAAPPRCMIVNATDHFLVFSSGKQHAERVPGHRAELIASG